MRFTLAPFALLVGVSQLIGTTLTLASVEPKVPAPGASEDEHSATAELLKVAKSEGGNEEDRQLFILEDLGQLTKLFSRERQTLQSSVEGISDLGLAFEKLGPFKPNVDIASAADRRRAAVKYLASEKFKVWSDLVDKHSKGATPEDDLRNKFLSRHMKYHYLKSVFGPEGLAEGIQLSKSTLRSLASRRIKELEETQFEVWRELDELEDDVLMEIDAVTSGEVRPTALAKSIAKSYGKYLEKVSSEPLD